MALIAGFERDAAGLLRVDTAAPVSSTWSGLPRTADGKLALADVKPKPPKGEGRCARCRARFGG